MKQYGSFMIFPFLKVRMKEFSFIKHFIIFYRDKTNNTNSPILKVDRDRNSGQL